MNGRVEGDDMNQCESWPSMCIALKYSCTEFVLLGCPVAAANSGNVAPSWLSTKFRHALSGPLSNLHLQSARVDEFLRQIQID